MTMPSPLIFKNASEALPVLLRRVLDQGVRTPSRNGTTKELAMQQVTLTHPFPAEITTPGRKVALPAQIAETMWILSGRNDIDWLSNYLPRAKDFSDDGMTWRGGYGPRLRNFGNDPQGEFGADGVDQLEHVVNLLRNDPETRRAVMAIYDPVIDTAPGKDIPCNNWVHFLPRAGELNAHIAIRSNDLMWGWSGINAFEWSALLEIVAGLTGFRQGSITFGISSLHLYENHWQRAENILETTAFMGGPPIFEKNNPDFRPQSRPINADPVADFDRLVKRWFDIEDLIRTRGDGRSEATIRSVIDNFPEPMLRSWLQVLNAWHRDDLSLASDIFGTSLYYALANSPKKRAKAEETPVAVVVPAVPQEGSFSAFVSDLHAEKHLAYGDSWKKRGEMLGIMANLARKIDRLGVSGGGDTAADTAIDLLAYAIKYRLWLSETTDAPRPATVPATGQLTSGPEHAEYVRSMVLHSDHHPDAIARAKSSAELIGAIRSTFDSLEKDVEVKWTSRWVSVDALIKLATPLARRCWLEETAAAKAQQAEGNETRMFSGYATADDAV